MIHICLSAGVFYAKKSVVLKKVLPLQPHFKVRGVAQLVSAPRSGRGGRKFESSHPD